MARIAIIVILFCRVTAQIATQEAAAEQAAIKDALGKEEAAKVAAAEAESPKKPLGFFDKLMKLVSAIYLCEPSAGFIITAINVGGGG